MSLEELNKMYSLIRLQDLSFNLIDRLMRRKKNEEITRTEGDWLAERPENWYQGPLILLETTEEGVLKEFETTNTP